MGTIKWDMTNPEMVIIGTDDGSVTGDAKELIDFYKGFMQNNPRYEVGTWDEAESIKIFYNTFISTKLALVNMIQDVAERNGNINVDVQTQRITNMNLSLNRNLHCWALSFYWTPIGGNKAFLLSIRNTSSIFRDAKIDIRKPPSFF